MRKMNIRKQDANQQKEIWHHLPPTKRKPSEDLKGYPILNEYKYLGVKIDYNLKYTAQIRMIREKIKKGMKMIEIMNWKRVDVWKRIYAWMTYIVPQFRYGSLIFQHNHPNQPS